MRINIQFPLTMPTIPPPPTPPPNGILLSTTTRNYLRSSLKNSVKPLDFQECLWAKEEQEVHRACFFAKVCPKDSPKICVYMNVKPILQVGEIYIISHLKIEFYFIHSFFCTCGFRTDLWLGCTQYDTKWEADFWRFEQRS